MVRKCLASILAAAMLAVIPQTIQAGWTRTYGGDDYDYAWSVQQTSDGNYIVVGSTWSFGAGKSDCWLLKVDDKGDTLWARTYGESESDFGLYVQQTSDGGYIITGSKTSVKEGDQDVWLFKTDSQGELLWEKSYGKDEHDYAWCVQQTSEGGYIIAGVKDYAKTGCVCPRAWLLKTDSQGDTLWTRSYGGDETSGAAYYVTETSDSGYVVVGQLALDLFLFKVNSDGDSLWTHTHSRGDYQHVGCCLQETPDKGFIITGVSFAPPESNASKVWLLKTDSVGDTLWTHTYGEEKLNIGEHVSITSDGGYIITGGRDYVGPGWGDLYLIKTDSEGDEEWNRTYGKTEAETDWGNCVQQTSDGGYIIAGDTESYGAGASDLWLIKTDSLGFVETVQEEPIADAPADWQVLSPIGHSIVLRYEDRPQGFSASVFDASGRKVDEIHASQASGTIIWGDTQTPGVYFIRSSSDNTMTTRKVILVK
ncbi:MAG: T9SS type A sorting domain-containing protein [Candidatus Stahlbacteria bacterium]|nr:MAG: T9SS type A sorting domain-containing protein [Candidatus Stahlbacteria bacterium]